MESGVLPMILELPQLFLALHGIPGRLIASQITTASIASFLPRLT
jgi:hypothetical protein